MAPAPRSKKLRIEPYDPQAVDADGDGIVQEGTAWERPFGTRILDELGRELVSGHTSNTFLSGAQYVDASGGAVEYAPRGVGATAAPSKSPLGRLGHPPLSERGMPSILEIQKRAMAATPPAAPAPVIEAKSLNIGFALDSIEFKAPIRPARSWHRRLRLEPYDPDAQDGDGDGIVQDGTAWERPVGTRVLTMYGREVARGMMTVRPSPGNKIVDGDGKDVDYTPKWVRKPAALQRARAAVTAPRSPVQRKRSAAALPDVPAAPGSTPIPAGHVRLYHYTAPDALDSIRETGLQLSRSRGSEMFEEDDFVWASVDLPRAATFVEFSIPLDDPRVGIGGLRVGNVGLRGDVLPDEFVAVHEGWHEKYRYLTEDDALIAQVLRGEFDHLLDMEDYGTAIRRIKEEFDLADEVMPAPELAPPKKGPSSPLGQLGHPTLAERGHATIDDYLNPPEISEPKEPKPAAKDQDPVEKKRKSLGGLPDLPPRSEWPPALPYDVGREVDPSDRAIVVDHDIEVALEHVFQDAAERIASIIDEQEGSIGLQRIDRPAIAKRLLEALGFSDISDAADALRVDIEDALDRHGGVISRHGQIRINLPYSAMVGLLESGRYKSQFETQTSRGTFHNAWRAEVEDEVMGIPVDMSPALRPVYGYIDVPGFPINPNSVNSYGFISITLRDAVRARTTMTIGDSGGTHAIPVPLVSPPAGSMYTAARSYLMDMMLAQILRDRFLDADMAAFLDRFDIDADALEGAFGDAAYYNLLMGFIRRGGWDALDDYPWAQEYIEAQIHGGVGLFDIESVVLPGYEEFSALAGVPITEDEYKQLIKTLKSLGIEVITPNG